MDFEVHCMSILHTKLSFFNYDKVKSVLQSIAPLRGAEFSPQNRGTLSRAVSVPGSPRVFKKS